METQKDNIEQQQQKPLVTVVIPVYNTEAYVEATVRSIFGQTLKEIEVILINDGSSDKSPEILQRLAESDSRARYISQSNKGLSATRNVGIEQAKADYLMFMDSDDLLAPDTLERCYKRCLAEGLDFVTFDAEPFSDDPKTIMSMTYDRSKCLSDVTVYTGADALLKQIEEKSFTPSACLYVVSKTLLNRCGLRFYEGILHEDELFTPQLYLNSEKMGYIPEKFFKRRFRSGSIMTNKISWRNINGYLTATAGLEAIRPKMDEYKNSIIDRFLSKMLNAVMWRAHTLSLGERLRLLRICIAKDYTKYVSTRSLATMMFKKYMKKG
jgi:glycosyltransferase involved in cell wall biosynthesis